MILGFPTTIKWNVPPAKPAGATIKWRRTNSLNLDNSDDTLRSSAGGVGSANVAPTGGSLLGTDNDILSNSLQVDMYTEASTTTPYIYKDLYFDVLASDVVSSAVFSWTYTYSCNYDCSYFANVYTGSWFQCDFIGGCAGPPCTYPQYPVRGGANDCYCNCYFPQTCTTTCSATGYNRVTYKTWTRYRYIPHSGFVNTKTVFSNYSSCSLC